MPSQLVVSCVSSYLSASGAVGFIHSSPVAFASTACKDSSGVRQSGVSHTISICITRSLVGEKKTPQLS